MKRLLLAAAALSLFSACTTYQTADNLKLVSFDDDIRPRKSQGPIEGQDCIWTVLGYRLGGMPTLDRALASARSQTKSSITDSVVSTANASGSNSIRYMNNVQTSTDGFNAVLVGKDCLIVKGVGYK